MNRTILLLDRNHFDNPVYTAGGRREDDRLLNNTHVIKNNLIKQNNTNLEKLRLGVAGCSTDEDDCKAMHYGSDDFIMKNKEADATNPNIYHSIDKLEHVYDEIKHKEIGNNFFENFYYLLHMYFFYRSL